MSQVWTSPTEGEALKITPRRLLRAVRRGVPLALVTFGCLALLLLVRLIERPLHRTARPWTPHITVFVCRTAFRLLGMGHRTVGTPMTGPGALVANHSSWLDIFALNAPTPLYFVSKAEVAGWPGIGWLARATGTVFIARRRTEAATHRA
ncbi:MAG: lysophospholipid acyltransferase family protein, partial [Shimia sp.]